MALGFGFKFGFANISSALSSAISWLLPFNLGLSATVGDDAVMAVGSDTTARVWDETLGLVLADVTAGNPVSEGMRLATTVADGAELSEELATTFVVGGDDGTNLAEVYADGFAENTETTE